MQSWEIWVKAAHIISVIAWMAGLLYLPRIFVYHTQSVRNSNESEIFKIMESRLLKTIMNPAMITVWITGPTVAYGYGEIQSTWLHAKLLLVVMMSGFHGYLVRQVKIFKADNNRHSAGFYKALNEVPTVLMMLIVILVVVKPI
jgi:protoporphyrinogen IX oxidase